MLRSIAVEAFPVVLDVWNNYLWENEEDDDCELYLYVRRDGIWFIDHCQYITDHRDIFSLAPIAPYESPRDLERELELNIVLVLGYGTVE